MCPQKQQNLVARTTDNVHHDINKNLSAKTGKPCGKNCRQYNISAIDNKNLVARTTDDEK